MIPKLDAAALTLDCANGEYRFSFEAAVRLVSESLSDVPRLDAEHARANGWNDLLRRTEPVRAKALTLTVAQVREAVETEFRLAVLGRVVAYARA